MESAHVATPTQKRTATMRNAAPAIITVVVVGFVLASRRHQLVKFSIQCSFSGFAILYQKSLRVKSKKKKIAYHL